MSTDYDAFAEPKDYNPDENPFGHAEFRKDPPMYHFPGAIDFFDATPEGDFLSNFYEGRPFCIRKPQDLLSQTAWDEIQAMPAYQGGELLTRLDDMAWPTGEHAFQAFKMEHIEDVLAVAESDSPGKAKVRGRTYIMRPDWPHKRVKVMRAVLRAKFALGRPEAERLLATGERMLIEGTTWGDRIWGVYHGEGQNLLGVLLMEQRGLLRYGKP